VIISLLLVASLIVQRPNVIVVPASSPFSLREAGPEYGDMTYFNGELTLHTANPFEWRIVDDAPESLELRIIPNAADLKALPFAENSPPTQFFVSNPEEAAGYLMTNEEKQSLLAAKLLESSGTATFKVRELFTLIECDSRSYWVTVVSDRSSNAVADTVVIHPRVGC